MARCRCSVSCVAALPSCATSSPTVSAGTSAAGRHRALRPLDHRDRGAPTRRQRLPAHALEMVVERTFAWVGRSRRLAEDYEATIQSTTAQLRLASTRLLFRRLATA